MSGTSFTTATTASTGDTIYSALPVQIDQGFTVLLTLRVTALYRNMRWAVWLLWLAFAIFQGMRVAVLVFGQVVVYSEVTFSRLYQQADLMYAGTIKYSPISRICVVGSASYRPTALIGIPTLFDLLLLVLTTCKALRSPSLKSNSIVRVKSRSSSCGILS